MIELYERYKGLLFSLAYQLTGSAADAEDAVQDVFLKVQNMNPDKLHEPKAYLCKMITNRCLDHLRSARVRREQYVGPWLPEPIAQYYDGGLEEVVRHDLLSYAMLALLERLSPSERAVFVLREALGFDYPAIAELTGKSEQNCRKLMSRARAKMGITEEELQAGGTIEQAWINRFVAALSEGEVDTVLSMLAEDAVLISDGGGKASAAVRPIESRERVAQFLLGIFRKSQFTSQMTVELKPLNGEPAFVFRQEGIVDSVVFLEQREGVLHRIFIVRNPDKLHNV
ncbi:DNA-directed RNA polymerase sigma-70 factor [Paenibacillus glycanilyticus]|uniref:DNA-directed RNA polymerase sigma-70 factor n=1 Tax=Paenibacillus glycanilyticus TaxID=126569 RepID=A0ABQ6NG77_9BACL|nr:RNA polymerase sigma-70 factor [Paenibacillus glycanilyticus]GMK44090.1 DNA-directed RNA polymerase sigma-70 factor [Paenibacillus glycanilyticus]